MAPWLPSYAAIGRPGRQDGVVTVGEGERPDLGESGVVVVWITIQGRTVKGVDSK